VVANMTRRRKTQIEDSLKNGDHPDETVESNSQNKASGQAGPGASVPSEAHEIGPLARQLLDILAIIALRMAAKRQQQEKQDK